MLLPWIQCEQELPDQDQDQTPGGHLSSLGGLSAQFPQEASGGPGPLQLQAVAMATLILLVAWQQVLLWSSCRDGTKDSRK